MYFFTHFLGCVVVCGVSGAPLNLQAIFFKTWDEFRPSRTSIFFKNRIQNAPRVKFEQNTHYPTFVVELQLKHGFDVIINFQFPPGFTKQNDVRVFAFQKIATSFFKNRGFKKQLLPSKVLLFSYGMGRRSCANDSKNSNTYQNLV